MQAVNMSGEKREGDADSNAFIGEDGEWTHRGISDSDPKRLPGGAFIQAERLISSTVLQEHPLLAETTSRGGQLERIKYVEVPVVEEVVRHVPTREYVEVERQVPKYEIEWVEKIIEIPHVEYVDKVVKVPEVCEVIKHVPVREVVEVPKEVVKYVQKKETRIVEKVVEVPGDVIDVPVPIVREREVHVPVIEEKSVKVVVAQTLQPCIEESALETFEIDVVDYNPRLVPVNIYVPKPVARPIRIKEVTESQRCVDIPPAHFNALLRSLNPTVTDTMLVGKMRHHQDTTPILAQLPPFLVLQD